MEENDNSTMSYIICNHAYLLVHYLKNKTSFMIFGCHCLIFQLNMEILPYLILTRFHTEDECMISCTKSDWKLPELGDEIHLQKIKRLLESLGNMLAVCLEMCGCKISFNPFTLRHA